MIQHLDIEGMLVWRSVNAIFTIFANMLQNGRKFPVEGDAGIERIVQWKLKTECTCPCERNRSAMPR
jgi:hypothetical protein